MLINIFTNAQKSQFRDMGKGKWQITGIPITVDNAVMNGVLYDAEENAKGLNSYRGKPLTLRHPADNNGNPVSAMEADGLMDYFSGGVIVNTYNMGGINYADAEFKESIMSAQDNGDYYVNRLKSGESVGISTGLYFDGNNESGVATNGDQYHARAINQVGDHVAMLPDDEPPAGGDATFIRFNGENDDQVITTNIDELIAHVNAEAQQIIDEVATNDEEKSLLTKFYAACKRIFATDNDSSDNTTCNEDLLTNDNKEGDAMRETLIATLAAKGISVNADISDTDLLAKYNEANTPDVAAAINAAVAPLTETVNALKTELAANANKELDGLAKQAAPILGLDEAEAKALGTNALHKVLAKNGVVSGNVTANSFQSPTEKAGSSIEMPWEK